MGVCLRDPQPFHMIAIKQEYKRNTLSRTESLSQVSPFLFITFCFDSVFIFPKMNQSDVLSIKDKAVTVY